MFARSVAHLNPALALLTAGCCLAAGADSMEAAHRVAAAQQRLPWFWSPPMEGLADVPYTYEMKQVKRRLNRRGGPRTLHMERIALAGGSYYRCLEQDGASPCSQELVEALERDSRKRESFTPEEKTRVAAIGEERRRRRRAFWSEFPKAFRFEPAGPDRIRFLPTGSYQPMRDSYTELLARIKGHFWFDPVTFEITRMEYELLADADNPLVRLAKGATFAVEMAKLAEGRYLPRRATLRRKLPKGQGTEETATEFSNLRRFAVESEIRFADPGEPDPPPGE